MSRRRFSPHLLVLPLILLVAAPTCAAAPDLLCKELSFGKTLDEVLKQFEGSETTRMSTPYIESIGSYAIEKYFKGGLQKDDSGICFLPNIVQKFKVRHKEWKDCDSVTLYLGAFEEDARDYSLFMVKRTLTKPPAESDFRMIFDEIARRKDKETGVTRTVDQGRVQSFKEQSHNFYMPALVGTWETNDTLVFVMVANSPEGPLPPEEIYVSKPALKRYLEVCKTY